MAHSDSSQAISDSAKVAFLVLVGLPGSGKTTLTLTLPHLLGSKYHIIHICYDEVISFKEAVRFDENLSSWKSERAKVLLATETLVNDLLSYNSPVNEECSYKLASFPKSHIFTENIGHKLEVKNLVPSNKCHITCDDDSCENLPTSKESGIELYCQSAVLSLAAKDIEEGSQGHYTMLDSFNSLVSMSDQFKDCDFGNELFLVCIDDNCYYRSMRKEWWNLAVKYKLPFCIITLECDVEVCIRRVRERFDSCPDSSPYIPDTVIRRMNNCLEIPNGDLHHWEKHSIVINTGILNTYGSYVRNLRVLRGRSLKGGMHALLSPSEIRNLINSAVREPAKHAFIEKHSDSSVIKSIIHAADLALRKVVGESDPKIRLQINVKRKKILEDLKNKKIIIPSDNLEEQGEGFGIKFDEYLISLLDLYQ
ncbi:uncharacterized protein LOC124169924 isoform X1 [Ischnura elegans]|uniref:uncharacterized protein LOC124169924 isoform X1 n=1 Tax=Ischnura elegans TaxID=197161 RepID=UPI001ED89E0F|nr:uncharacterized protein LOC124169924 isoform X1 [Ischnura elegans]XP_046404628.1 uncharacterized protein LOC124169924 isoform X1 [Ischnura elegans]